VLQLVQIQNVASDVHDDLEVVECTAGGSKSV
jgi:hypothetical protein